MLSAARQKAIRRQQFPFTNSCTRRSSVTKTCSATQRGQMSYLTAHTRHYDPNYSCTVWLCWCGCSNGAREVVTLLLVRMSRLVSCSLRSNWRSPTEFQSNVKYGNQNMLRTKLRSCGLTLSLRLGASRCDQCQWFLTSIDSKYFEIWL